MKTEKNRKLSLNRETVRTLSGEKLEEVAGGLPSGRCWPETLTCPTYFCTC
jgi:hypothetical protein